MLVKITMVQSQLGQKLSLGERLLIFKQKPDYICFPEYFLVAPEDPDFSRSALKIKEHREYLKSLSIAFSACIIGGSLVEAGDGALYNSTYIYERGNYLGKYRKLNPVSGEMAKGILPGDKVYIQVVDNIKIAVLICADALNIDLFKLIAPEDVDLIFIPTTSPLRPYELTAEKFRRDNDIYVRAAQEAACFIVKTCGIGTLFGKPLQGRSLIAAPWGLIKRVEPSAEAASLILTTILDIEEIRDFRKKKSLIAAELNALRKDKK